MSKKRRKTAARGVPPSRIAKVLSRCTPLRLEIAGLVVLVCLTSYFLAISWRKWPDPLIDFGRELYLPWRLANGAILFRDVMAQFGPLSQYFNALLFRIFGPGLMVLVTANLLIYVAIVATFYLLARRAWGRLGAFAASATFISVFSFTQLVVVSNYNYATPYAHETTHGMLVVLALVFALLRWAENPRPLWSFFAGFLLGLTALLKPEFLLAGCLLVAVALLFRWRYQGPPTVTAVGAAVVGALVPTAAFTAYFSACFLWRDALRETSHGWLRFATPKVSSVVTPLQAGFTGLDHAHSNLASHAFATLIALLLIVALVATRFVVRRIASTSSFIAFGIVSVVAVAFASSRFINWVEIGKGLLGPVLLYALVRFALILRKDILPERMTRELARVLLAVLACALLTRMALNGRIYHYGFYQAAIAGCIVPAIVLTELPEWIGASVRERLLVIALGAALFVPGVSSITRRSHAFLALKTASVGQGRDRFYAFNRQLDPTGEIVNAVSDALKTTNTFRTLIVIPEGVIINYLARIPTPLPDYFFPSSSPLLAERMEKSAPEGVVLISRNLREYGIQEFGAKPGEGEELITWLSGHYRQVAHTGGNPLDVRQRGAIIFKRKETP